MVLSILFQGIMMNRAIANPQLNTLSWFPPNPWMYFARSIVPQVITLCCTLGLYVRTSREYRKEPGGARRTLIASGDR
jgi:hypothetical protein